jgi:hypothetical protein
LHDYYEQLGEAQPFTLRVETFRRIEAATQRPLICYVSKTRNVPQGVPSYIDDSDLTGFSDLIYSTSGNEVDVLLVSNGGSAEATERIVRMLRERFTSIRFILPANAYSAATLLAFSGEQLIMSSQATLGPIDPQLNGIPARAILRSFETLEEKFKTEGPGGLTAYMPLVMKYDLHMLEMARSMEEYSRELARTWLSTYMFKCPEDDERVTRIVAFFSDYDSLKTHGRSIDRTRARDLGLEVANTEATAGLDDLVRSLSNQYELWFDRTPFYKDFENARGIAWGRQIQTHTMQAGQPGPPQRSG